LISLYELFQTR